MPTCDICGAKDKELEVCQACKKKFCDSCGDQVDERCEFCSSEEDW